MVDWARLENEYTGNGIAGSNPASAAKLGKAKSSAKSGEGKKQDLTFVFVMAYNKS